MRSFCIFLSLCVALASNGQEKPAFLQGHQGPRIGFGMATQSNGQLFGNTSNLLIGPVIGWHFEAPLHPQVSLMPEILWMTKGLSLIHISEPTRPY